MILKNNSDSKIIGDGYCNLNHLYIDKNNTTLNVSSIDNFLNKDITDFRTPIIIQYDDSLGKIQLKNNQIVLSANNDKNFYNLFSYLISLSENNRVQPNMIVKDYPNINYREFMLDIARNFIPLNEIKKIIDEMFRNRINYFHLHFSDDENYAIESTYHPEINTKEFLTKSEIKDLIDYCSNRGIEVIPEFDIPGHMNHLLEIKKELRCNSEKGNSICFAKDHTILFDLIDEICEMFPSKYYHIGADELGVKNQYNCPLCKDLMIKNEYTSPKQLAASFINQVAEYVQSKGKVAIAWNDCLKYGKINEDVIIQKWFNYYKDTSCIDEIKKGRKVIISSATDTYINGPYSLIPLQKTYEYIPEINGKIIDDPYGVSCHCWTEVIVGSEQLESEIFPRLQAFGENAWLEYDKKNYKDFLLRVQKELELLKDRDISYTELNKVDKFSFVELNDYLYQKLKFKNYTDFVTMDLLKMISEYYFPRKYPELKRKRH